MHTKTLALACCAACAVLGTPAVAGPAAPTPASCPSTVGLPYDHGLWRGNIEYYTLPVEEVRWFPGSSEGSGYVECLARRDDLGSARPTLLSVFAVSRPQGPQWQADKTWLSCRPGDDPGRCAFDGAAPASAGASDTTVAGSGLREAVQAAPGICESAVRYRDDYDPELWVANVQQRVVQPDGAPTMEVRWVPLPDDPEAKLGYVECAAASWHSGFPEPTLRSRFVVQRPPQQDGWREPVPGDSWLLCSGATMMHFEVAGCPFSPAEPAR